MPSQKSECGIVKIGGAFGSIAICRHKLKNTSCLLTRIVSSAFVAELQRPVFAALVPKNKDKLLRELIDEVMGDHRRLVSRPAFDEGRLPSSAARKH